MIGFINEGIELCNNYKLKLQKCETVKNKEILKLKYWCENLKFYQRVELRLPTFVMRLLTSR